MWRGKPHEAAGRVGPSRCRDITTPPSSGRPVAGMFVAALDTREHSHMEAIEVTAVEKLLAADGRGAKEGLTEEGTEPVVPGPAQLAS